MRLCSLKSRNPAPVILSLPPVILSLPPVILSVAKDQVDC
jgi:hypothetical protein